MDRVSQWLKLARFAPSGANRQNWKVTVEVESPAEIILRMGLRQESSLDHLDLSGGGALIGLGALIETLMLVAARDSWAVARWDVIPAESLARTKVRLGFSPVSAAGGGGHNHLYEQILLRRTNRFPYETGELEDLHRKIVFQDNELFGVQVLEFSETKNVCIDLLKPLVKLQSRNKNLFFGTIREIHLVRNYDRLDAIPVQAAGVDLLGHAMLRFIQKWPGFYPLMKFGITTPFVAQGWTQPILKSGMLYHFATEQGAGEDWIILGRFLQRAWLKWTEAGLVAQPFGVPLLAYGALTGLANEVLTQEEIRLIAQFRESLLKSTAIDLKRPGLFVRVGYPTAQAVFTPRCPLVGTVNGSGGIRAF